MTLKLRQVNEYNNVDKSAKKGRESMSVQEINPIQDFTDSIFRHWCSLIKGEKSYGVRLRGNGEIIKT